MKDRIHIFHTRSLIVFWINFISLAFVFLYILQAQGGILGTETKQSAAFERYAIILTLAAIPLALKYFHSTYKKIETGGQESFLKKYTQAAIIRIAILDVVIVANIIGFYMFKTQNFVFMDIITFFALLFCLPNKTLLHIEPKTNENINKEE